jgi:hypothetical protein
MILKATPKKPLRAAGAVTLVAMGQDFTGTATQTTIYGCATSYNENEIHFHLRFIQALTCGKHGLTITHPLRANPCVKRRKFFIST